MDLLNELLEKPVLAKNRIRVFAALVDFILLTLLFYIIALMTGQTNTDGNFGFHLQGWPALIAMALGFLLIPVMEGTTGQTIGKRIFKIKVVKVDYTPTVLGTSIVRHLFDFVDCFFLAGLVVAATNKNKQRVGDLVAKTLVVTSS